MHSNPPVSIPEITVSGGNDEIGGFGIYFIYQTMDTVSYETGEAGNRLTSVKKLRP